MLLLIFYRYDPKKNSWVILKFLEVFVVVDLQTIIIIEDSSNKIGSVRFMKFSVYIFVPNLLISPNI